MNVEERRISVDELVRGRRQVHGALEECFGTGTAAVISPVGALRYEDTDHGASAAAKSAR